MRKYFRFRSIFSLIILLLFGSLSMTAQETKDAWPKRVLVTNDNGIDDIKMIELARAFAKVAETYVVAPAEDRSGATNYSSLLIKGKITVQQHSIGEGIVAYSVEGYPADCVLFSGLALLKDNPPDLVVSGINGGPNLSIEWFGSGTIGAARIAAFGGIPAIAVSGLETKCSECIAAATAWVVELAKSDVVRNLESGQYLTVSIPRKRPSEIKGVKVVKRAPILALPSLEKIPPSSEKLNVETWIVKPPAEFTLPPADSDVAVWNSNYIAIVPMSVDEHDYMLLNKIKEKIGNFPNWPASNTKEN